MSYTKIYYDDIWAVTSKGSTLCGNWLTNLQELDKKFTSFVESESFTGQAATNMKNYLEQIHGILVAIIGSVVQTYYVLAIDYYSGYTRLVDSGDDEEYGLRYTTIVNDEVCELGSIQNKLDGIINTAEQVAEDANNVKKSISDLVSIASYPKTDNLYEQIKEAKSKTQTVHNNAKNYEASRVNDFVEIDRLISQALSIINAQIGKTRVPVVEYQSGSIGTMCDIRQLSADLTATSEKITSITKNGYFEEDAELVLNRDALIHEEEKAEREWAQWVATGVAVIGAIALTVATAGALGPAGCAVVGAVTAAGTAAAADFANNYVENGTWFEGMDWSEFGKHVVVAAVGGAVGGYLGAASQGSAIQQPIKKAFTAGGKAMAKEAAEGAVSMALDVGEAVLARKPKDEIVSILKKDAVEMGKKTTAEGAKEFVSGWIAGGYEIDASDKSAWRKAGEKIVTEVSGDVASGVVNTGWDCGEAVLDDDSSTTITSAINENIEETAGNIVGSAASAIVSETAFHSVDDIDNKAAKIAGNTVKDTVSDAAEEVSKGVTSRTAEYILGDEKDASKILGDIWEEDLQSGRTLAKSAGESAGKNIVNEKKYYNDLKRIDKNSNNDGKIEVVQFGDYAVTKQDYDAAIENAGKGAYKDKTAQDLLGLPKDTDINAGKQRTVSIDMTEKYSSDRKTTDTVTVDGKYTFSESYYESSLNVAGSEEYGEKSAQEILGIPDDVDLSEDNVTYKRVDNDKIGQGKGKVELHQDYETQATKIHISSMKSETRKDREKEKKKEEKEEKKKQ